MRETFEQRMIDTNAVRELRKCVLRAARDVSPKVHDRMVAIADQLHHEVCTNARGLNSVLNAAATRVESDETTLADVQDESTPAERPIAIQLERLRQEAERVPRRPWWRLW